MTLDVDAVRSFCRGREVDLVIAPPPLPFELCLHGEFNGYGDFFSLLLRGVSYVELAGGFTVGDLVQVESVDMLPRLAPRWSRLVELYVGPAIAFRTAYSEAWDGSADVFVVVAEELQCREGRDWHRGLTPG